MSNKKILIIDEEYWSIEPAIDRIKNAFGEESVVYCADGAEGINRLMNEQFSCIILDIMFPLGSELENDDDDSDSIKGGLIILKRVREVLRLKIPIICFTIRDDDDVKNEIEKYNNSYHVSKLNAKALELLISQIKKYV